VLAQLLIELADVKQLVSKLPKEPNAGCVNIKQTCTDCERCQRPLVMPTHSWIQGNFWQHQWCVFCGRLSLFLAIVSVVIFFWQLAATCGF